MTERVLDIAEGPARLSVDLGRIVARIGGQTVAIQAEELAAVVVSAPGVTYTHAVLAALAEAGVPFVCCDERRMPSGLMLPLRGNDTQAERFRAQAAMRPPLKKRLWRQLVVAKIRSQAAALRRLGKEPGHMGALWRRVRSGDPDNVEGQAARLYWPILFGDSRFRRDPGGGGPNGLLNYGYAVLRAMTARAVCAAGLHPSLGLHHHNRHDAFCLVNDMMEPWRPLVDESAARIATARELSGEEADGVSIADKRRLLGDLTARRKFDGECRRLSEALRRACVSLAETALRGDGTLDLWEGGTLCANTEETEDGV